jgi:hypothetical protein
MNFLIFPPQDDKNRAWFFRLALKMLFSVFGAAPAACGNSIRIKIDRGSDQP